METKCVVAQDCALLKVLTVLNSLAIRWQVCDLDSDKADRYECKLDLEVSKMKRRPKAVDLTSGKYMVETARDYQCQRAVVLINPPSELQALFFSHIPTQCNLGGP